MLFDPIYWIILGVSGLLSLLASLYVKSAFRSGAEVPIQSGLTGAEVARRILRDQDIVDVEVSATATFGGAATAAAAAAAGVAAARAGSGAVGQDLARSAVGQDAEDAPLARELGRRALRRRAALALEHAVDDLLQLVGRRWRRELVAPVPDNNDDDDARTQASRC